MARAVVRVCALAVALAVLGPPAASAAPGAAPGRISDRPCFGAPTRDPAARCNDPVLRRHAIPHPDDAALQLSEECGDVVRSGELFECTFLDAPAQPARRFALIGDSHAAHWRAGLMLAAKELGWFGTSLTRASCPFTTATPILRGKPKSQVRGCRRWQREVYGWLQARPEVDTVVIGQHATARVVVPRGRTAFEAAVRGYSRMWEILPPSVTRIVVIRDTTHNKERTADCVRRAIREKRRMDKACAVARRRVLFADPAAEAARRLNSERVKVIDPVPLMCSTRWCFPVVGGALVHKDETHITATFSRSAAPFLARRLRLLAPLPS